MYIIYTSLILRPGSEADRLSACTGITAHVGPGGPVVEVEPLQIIE